MTLDNRSTRRQTIDEAIKMQTRLARGAKSGKTRASQ